MRVGFVTHLLWDRYGPFWLRLLEAAGADVSTADPARVDAVIASDARLDAVSGAAFRRAAAEAIALAGCDRVVVPQLNPGYEGAKGSAQDPFVADLPAALGRAVPGLPSLLSVPASLTDPEVERIAVAVLNAVAPSSGSVRRVWQTHRADARAARPEGVRPAPTPSATSTVALVGQPWHLSEAVRARLEGPGEHLISAHQLAPHDLRSEGGRVDAGMAPTDAEALGAVRLFARRGGVARIRMVVDPTSGADAWLERKARALVRRPFETVPLPPPLPAEVPATAPDTEGAEEPGPEPAASDEVRKD